MTLPFRYGSRVRAWPASNVTGDVICNLTSVVYPDRDGRVFHKNDTVSNRVSYYIPKDVLGNEFQYCKETRRCVSCYDVMSERNVIWLFGVTREGATVSIQVLNYRPEFLLMIEPEWTDQHISRFVRSVRGMAQQKCLERYAGTTDFSRALAEFNAGLANTLVTKSDDTIDTVYRYRYRGFDFNQKRRFLVFRFRSIQGYMLYSRLFHNPYEKSLKKRQPLVQNPFSGKKQHWKVYGFDRDLPLLSLYHRYNIAPAGWIRVRQYQVNPRAPTVANIRLTVDIDRHETPFEPVESADVAPALVASFDIECIGNNGFPQPERPEDLCFMIGTTVTRVGDERILMRYLACVGSCELPDTSPETLVESFKTEPEMMLGWARFMRKLNPDIVTGYNIDGFDFRYLFVRAHQIHGIREEFCGLLGRLNRWTANLHMKELTSSALSQNFLYRLIMPGWVSMDMYHVIKGDVTKKLESYKLDHVSTLYLGDKKRDLSPREMFDLYRKGARERGIVADYCVQDCALVNRLSVRLCGVVNSIGMANTTFVPLEYIFTRGQGIKIFSYMTKVCQDYGYVISARLKDEKFPWTYEGAVVFDASAKFIDQPVTCVDYASLYPRSARWYNFCPTCHVQHQDLPRVQEMIDRNEIIVDWMTYCDAYPRVWNKKTNAWNDPKIYPNEATKQYWKELECPERTPGQQRCIVSFKCPGTGNECSVLVPDSIANHETFHVVVKHHCFVQPPKGAVSARMLKHLSVARSQAKKRMKNAKAAGDRMGAMVYNGEQLSLKVVANSTYGQWGSRIGPLGYMPVAACITAAGRQTILFTRDVIIELDVVLGSDGKEHMVAPHDPEATADSEATEPGSVLYSRPFRIVYGDTDSVFYNLAYPTDVAYAMRLAPHVTAEVERRLKILRPHAAMIHCLEPEKIAFPMALLSRKRYFYKCYEWDSRVRTAEDVAKPKVVSMGDASKRRGFAPVVKQIYNRIKMILLDTHNFNQAVLESVQAIDALLAHEYSEDLDAFVITRSIKDERSYKKPKTVQHLQLAKRMRSRDAGCQIQSGDRIQICYIERLNIAKKDLGAGDTIEDPAWVRKHRLRVDVLRYLEHTVEALSQVLAMRIPHAEHLFDAMVKSEKERRRYVRKVNLQQQKLKASGQPIFGAPPDPTRDPRGQYRKFNYSVSTDMAAVARRNYRASAKYKNELRKCQMQVNGRVAFRL